MALGPVPIAGGERYARDEIKREEYLQKKRDILGN